ncbi:hypothetical protein D3C77_167800 [compost metagenome]
MQAHLAQRLRAAETGAIGLDQNQRSVLGALAGVAGLGHHHDDVAVAAVGDEGLGTVDDILIAIQYRTGLDRLQVGTGIRFGHGHRTDGLACGHFRQPGVLLRFAAEIHQVAGNDVMHTEADQPGRKAGAVDLFSGDHRETPIQLQPAIGRRCGRVEHAQLAGTGPDLTGYAMIGFPLLLAGGTFLCQEAPHAVAKLLVLMIEQATRNH